MVAGGVTAAVVRPAAGIPVALATFVAVVSPYGRVLLAIGSVGLLVAVDRMVSAAQTKFHYAAEFGWPTHFETASILAWLAVAALAADALVQEVRERRIRGGAAATAPHAPRGVAPRPPPGQARPPHLTGNGGAMLRSTG